MKKHDLILNIESKSGEFLSEIDLGVIVLDESQFKKLDRIYFNVDYKSGSYKYIIYKGSIPFYLSLEQTHELKYDTTCYCSPENYDKVRIFLNTILKNQKNANNNNFGN